MMAVCVLTVFAGCRHTEETIPGLVQEGASAVTEPEVSVSGREGGIRLG